MQSVAVAAFTVGSIGVVKTAPTPVTAFAVLLFDCVVGALSPEVLVEVEPGTEVGERAVDVVGRAWPVEPSPQEVRLKIANTPANTQVLPGKCEVLLGVILFAPVAIG